MSSRIMKASIGYPIGVYQDTIGKTFKEYLVNFDYFTQVMENYGFVLIEDMDAKDMGLPSGTGLFKELFDVLRTQTESDPKLKKDIGTALQMTQHEKKVSFLNRYFIFRKMRDVNTEELFHTFTDISDEQTGTEQKDTREAAQAVGAEQKMFKVKVKKLKKRIKLTEPKKPTA